MKKYFLLSLFILFYADANEEALKKAIANRDITTVQKLLEQQKHPTERSALQQLGRQTLIDLYQAAEKEEADAKEGTETYINRHVATRLVKVGCCFTGAGYQAVKLAINWHNFHNWSETALGCYLAVQGFADFYVALTNQDAKNEHNKTQLIKQSLQELNNYHTNTHTVNLSDLEKQ